MKRRNLDHFDLNLIKVFLAIWELRSISAAGDRLGLTQPAVSHSLRRLREQLDDPVFLRVGHRMEPTDAARRLREPLERAVGLISNALLARAEFDASSSDRTFTIAMSDVAEFYMLPQILSCLVTAAPSLRIRSVKLDADNVAASLRTGQIDMALGYLPDLPKSDFPNSLLLEDRFVCLVSSSHPMARKVLTKRDFSKLTFIDVAVHSTSYKAMDALLTNLGAKRNNVLRIEHFAIVPEIVRHTRLAAIFPYSVSIKVNAAGEFSLLEIPFDLLTMDIRLYIHSNFQEDPGLQWMRNAITGAITQVPKSR